MNSEKDTTYFALNRHTMQACQLTGFSCWEMVQGAFRCGIMMPNGTMANGIGRCASPADFVQRAKHGKWTVMGYFEHF